MHSYLYEYSKLPTERGFNPNTLIFVHNLFMDHPLTCKSHLNGNENRLHEIPSHMIKCNYSFLFSAADLSQGYCWAGPENPSLRSPMQTNAITLLCIHVTYSHINAPWTLCLLPRHVTVSNTRDKFLILG